MTGGFAAAWDVLDASRRANLPAAPVAAQSWPTSQDSDLSLWEAFTGSMPGNLPAVTENTITSVTAVYACVALLAGSISMLPVRIYDRQSDGERSELPDHDLWWTLNEQFCPRWSAANGWEFLALSLLFHGNGFAQILRTGDKPTGLLPIHPGRVQVLIAPGGERLLYVIEPDPADILSPATRRLVLDQDDVIHIAGLGFSGVRAPSPLRHHLRAASQVAMATQQYASTFFSNGARPDYVLQSDGTPKQDEIARLRQDLEESHGGIMNRGKPMILTGGLKFQAVTMPMEDVELLALRKFSVEDIARAFSMQPWMIGHEQKMALGGGGAESIGTHFVRFTLGPHLVRIVTELNRKLWRRGRTFVEFDTFGLEKADMKSLFEALRIAIGRAGEPGFLSTDEVRKIINYGRTDGGSALKPADVPAKESTNA